MNSIRWMSTANSKTTHQQEIKDKIHGRSKFLQDFGSIVHSSKFRRLSNKTQVFLNPQLDYPRTRLTHSNEVSQIGRQLARYFSLMISKKSLETYHCATLRHFKDDFEDLVASACLVHDLGQPPFGHKGERTLADLTKELTGNSFDSNKQNVRLLLGTNAREPMGVSCALVDAVMKYKADQFKSKCKYPGFYESEREAVEKILTETGLSSIRHPACYLMEAADDIAYICGDAEDGLRLGIVKPQEIADRLSKYSVLNENYDKTSTKWADILNKCKEKEDYQEFLSALMKVLVSSTLNSISDAVKDKDLEEIPDIMSSVFGRNNVEPLNPLYHQNGEGFKSIKDWLYYDALLKHHEIARNELLAEKVIKDLWNLLLPLTTPEYKNLSIYNIIPPHVRTRVESVQNAEGNKTMLQQDLADYISGMTDRFAIDLWSRLSNPSHLKSA